MSVIVKNGFQYYSSYNEQFKEVTLEEYNELERKGLVDNRTVYCVIDYNDAISADKIMYDDEYVSLNVDNSQDAIEVMNTKNNDYFDLFRFRCFYRDNISLSANSHSSYTFDVSSIEGYTPVGIMFRSSDNATDSGAGCSLIHFTNFWIEDTAKKVGWGMRNKRDSASKVRITMGIMFIKDEYYDRYKSSSVIML